ncbi:MFS transporter [Streptomyces sp. MUM 178J]|uniref:MFS transporter n=1 Tax=Streptomyces sp. MUM 178J TaxID=2791991 RepID=UPI001F033C04|nr:MFS transporter [Streptomyces sp. MUM 178J]WRQ80748.1 MFS transporter [Streptomyces sp. MUM 178J]
MTTAAATRWDGRMRAYLGGYMLSAIGNGLVLPLTVIYLTSARHLTASQLGVYFGTLAVTGLLFNPVAGHLVDRFGSRSMLLLAMTGQATGWMALSAFTHWPWPLVSAVLIGLSNELFFSSQLAFLERVLGPEALPRIFAAQHRVANLVVAVPALFSGILVSGMGDNMLRWFIMANGLTFLLFAGVLAYISRGTTLRASEAAPDSGTRPGSVLTPYRDRRFVPLLLVQFCVVAFAMAQLDTVVPALLQASVADAAAMASVLIASNGVAVFIIGGRARAFAQRIKEPKALALAFVLWGAGIPLLAVCLQDHGSPLRWVLVACYGAYFALPEVLVAPSLKPLAAKLSPARLKGRYGAAISFAYSLGLLCGPPLTFGLAGTDTTPALIIMAVGSVLGLGAAVLLHAEGRKERSPVHNASAAVS